VSETVICPECVQRRVDARVRDILYRPGATTIGDTFDLVRCDATTVNNVNLVMVRIKCKECGAQLVFEQVAQQDAEGTWRVKSLLP